MKREYDHISRWKGNMTTLANEKGRSETSPDGSALGLPHPWHRQVGIIIEVIFSVLWFFFKSIHSFLVLFPFLHMFFGEQWNPFIFRFGWITLNEFPFGKFVLLLLAAMEPRLVLFVFVLFVFVLFIFVLFVFVFVLFALLLLTAMEPRLVTRWEAARWAREAYTIGARFVKIEAPVHVQMVKSWISEAYTTGARCRLFKIFHVCLDWSCIPMIRANKFPSRVLGGCCGWEPYHIRQGVKWYVYVKLTFKWLCNDTLNFTHFWHQGNCWGAGGGEGWSSGGKRQIWFWPENPEKEGGPWETRLCWERR